MQVPTSNVTKFPQRQELPQIPPEYLLMAAATVHEQQQHELAKKPADGK